ncbi:unnamed protein product [Haemonchus placei]|uniref:Osteoclast-stimulating factor 1 n=1 Tax=Haemonchus placei TaxID=6290 RepID=A0A0N4W5F1_HAEPC|nr:unnamed protein product [Haemonchus placei]
MTTAPPRPAPKPGRVRVYRALYDYAARTDQEMSFAEGDLLYVSDRGPNDDWLPATCGGKKGLVPANYEELSNPLHEAARRGNINFLKDCINNQVSVNSLDKSGSTALYWACHGGHLGVVKCLLEHPGITISSQASEIFEVKFFSSRFLPAQSTQRFASSLGCCPRDYLRLSKPQRYPVIDDCLRNKLGDTPLHAASWRGHRECVQLLLDSGANAWIRNRDQKLPIDLAKDAEIAGLLDQAMRRDTRNEDCENEYESGSDQEQ